MEYVAGKSLRDVIDMAIKRKEKIHAELCRLVAEMICDGASYAHNLTDMSGRSLNLVHRDLNPQNVLISYTGDVKVIDFGIAKSEMSTVKTEAGMIKGKFVYMSPEQSLAKKLDKRSDIFAIGISLYEMLTGINPFHKNNIVLTLEAVQRYEPPPPSEYDPSYAPFDPIVAKALTKDRDRRYSDASEMMDDLRRIVLPRAPERLGQFMQRIFRAQVEEEQKMLIDSDSLKLYSSGPKKTPVKPAHTPPKPGAASHPLAAPDGQANVDATDPVPIPARRPPVTPSKAPPVAARPAPRAPPPAPAKKQQGAGDTLIDMGGVASAPEPGPDDEVPGGTAMLKPGQALPPPPPRKLAPRPSDAMPAIPDEGEPPEGATAFLGTAPKRGPAKRGPPASVTPASTNIMTPEESQAAQQEALAKLQQAQQGVIRTRTRADKRGELKQQKSSKGMWLMLGGGLVVAMLLIGGLLYFLLQDESSSGATRRRKTTLPMEQTQVVPDPAPAPEEQKAAPPPEEKPKPRRAEQAEPPPADDTSGEATPAPAPTPAPAKSIPAKKVASGKVLGMLTLNPGPNVPVTFAGNTLPKQVGAFNLPVTHDIGTIAVGDDSTQFKVTLDYMLEGGTIVFKLNASPWAIASVNGPSRGRTPVDDLRVDNKTQTVVELKKPGADTGMTLRLLYKGR